MKKIFILACLLQLSIVSYAQGIAPNWTLPDCSAANHTLYNYLDSQEVVVMEFVMGCSSCTDAGNILMTVKDQYDVSHPGKVNFFLMDYFPSNTCLDVTTTWGAYNFNAYFSGCWAEKDYYYPTIYPMPAIVIAAGNYHTVIYQDLSWQASDSTLIKQAIDQFFNTVSIEDQKAEQALVYPNPATEVLYFNLSAFNLDQLKLNVYDMQGKQVKAFVYRIDKNMLVLNISNFIQGNYLLEMQDGDKTIRKKFIKD